MQNKVFIIADTHFNHANIIKYCNRPFKDVKEMEKYIITKWNSVVAPDDTVYHLGDVGFGSFEELKNLLTKLNGKKILIMGNHDLSRGRNTWLKIGFAEVYKKELTIGNYVLSHYPKRIEDNQINFFGHIHNKPLNDTFNKNNHINVSVEVVDYTPLEITKILEEKK